MTYLSRTPNPRIRVTPLGLEADSEVEVAVRLANLCGIYLDSWQYEALSDLMQVRGAVGSHDWSSKRFGLSVSRQSGKSLIAECRMLYGLFVMNEPAIYTAHEVKTAKSIMQRLIQIIDSVPELKNRIKTIRVANGQELIETTGGGRLEFIARSKNSGRGKSAQTLYIDEAQEVSEDAMAALLPTISSYPLNQQIYLRTPPSPSANGDVFSRLRASALDGTDTHISWTEYGIEPGDDLDDLENWYTAIPALGIRITVETVEGERAALSDDDFARERLGLWTTASTSGVFSSDVWAACADPDSEPVSDLVLAVDISPNRQNATIAVAGLREDGRYHVEIVDMRPGTSWVAKRLIDVATRQGIRTVVLDGASPAATLVDQLKKSKLRVETTSAKDMGLAAGEFYDAVVQQNLAHLDDVRTNAAILAVRKRRISGDLFAWNRQAAASDITPVVAATLALWGVTSTRVKKRAKTSDPSGKRRVVVL